jgi:hypothetical protein
MSTRELILLTPYRLPAQNALYLGDDDVAAFLNGLTALWHPAALLGAAGPPRVASPYDHDKPTAGHLYAVAAQPTAMLPDDWKYRVKEAGAVAFEATASREETLANLREALRDQPGAAPEQAALLDLDAQRFGPFFGVGFGHTMIEGLCEAMSHQNLLAADEFWKEVQEAARAAAGNDNDAVRRALQSAADRLMSAREVLYPVSMHLVDLCLPDENQLAQPWPASLTGGLPCNVIACAALLERLSREQPEKFALLRERVAADHAEVIGGPYLEREDAILPLESQLANLVKGPGVYKELLGREPRVFGRKRFGFHPQLPQLLNSVGINRVLLLAFDDSILPDFRATVVSWPSADGKQVEAFPRAPQPAETAQTYFHFAHHLHRTIMQDQSATLALLHKGQAAPWYDDLLELSRFAPVLGRWATLTNYFNEVTAGDYASASSADDFRSSYLEERLPSAGKAPPEVQREPISGLVRQMRLRRGVDTAWTLCALHRALAGKVPDGATPEIEKALDALEERVEFTTAATQDEVTGAVDRAAAELAKRLMARATNDEPGYLLLNPCGFRRRVALALPDIPAPLPLNPPLIASQSDGKTGRLVVEIPALGFAWVPKRGPAAAPPASRMKLADKRCVRNESFEAEVDATTGGLKAIRDHRSRVNRLGQMLVFNPGSTMHVDKIETVSTGPALGEIVSEGVLADVQNQVIAHWRQRFRAWVGRPVLDLRIEIHPVAPPVGYPWHSYYAARFAWRDERNAVLLRGSGGGPQPTTHPRPESPDFIELRSGAYRTTILPGGLPFHQRQGTRMLDVLLICEGEEARAFDLAVALDRDYPMQTALGMATPPVVVETSKGPPHVGATGWLFHLDAPNLLMTSLRPDPRGADAVTARLLECAGHDGPAEFRCARDPRRGMLLDGRGNQLLEASVKGDAVSLDVSRHDLLQLRVEFS